MAQTGQFLQEIVELVQSQERLQKEMDQERSHTQAMQKQLQAEKDKWNRNHAKLENDIAERDREIASLRSQVASAQAQIKSAQAEFASQFEAHSMRQSRAHQMEMEKKEASYRRAFQEALVTKEKAFQDKTRQLLEWKAQAEARLTEIGKEKQRLAPENQRLKAQNESLQQAIERDEAEIKKLQHQLQSLFAERENLRARFLHETKMIQGQAQKSEADAHAAAQEIKRIRQESLAQRRRIQELEQELDFVKRRAPLTELLSIKTDQIARLQSDLAQPWLQSEAAREMIQEKINELDRVREQITSELNH